MAGRIARWGAALGLGALWWWGVLRLALAPDAGALEGAVVAGGWGLSLLPVHCVPKAEAMRAGCRGARAAGGVATAWGAWGARAGGFVAAGRLVAGAGAGAARLGARGAWGSAREGAGLSGGGCRGDVAGRMPGAAAWGCHRGCRGRRGGAAGGYQGIATPPFGRRICPVVNAEASEARCSTAWAMSSGSPTRPSGDSRAMTASVRAWASP